MRRLSACPAGRGRHHCRGDALLRQADCLVPHRLQVLRGARLRQDPNDHPADLLKAATVLSKEVVGWVVSMAGVGTASLGAALLLVYFQRIGFPEIFLPVVGSPQVLLAFLFTAAFLATVIVAVFLSPVYMINPSDEEIRRLYKSFDISTVKLVGALLTFPAVLILLSFFTQKLWPILMIVFLFHLLISKVGIKKKINLIFAKQWVGLAVYWLIASLFCLWPILVVIRLSGEVWTQLLILFLYFLLLVAILHGVRKFGWPLFLITLVCFLVPALIWGNDFFMPAAARLLGARHDDLRWYWVDSKVIQSLPQGMIGHLADNKEGYYVRAMTPFSTSDIHVLCSNKDAINRHNCILAFDKSDAKSTTAFQENVP